MMESRTTDQALLVGLIEAYRARLTKRQREVLARMANPGPDEDGELVMEGRRAFIECDPVAPSTVYALLRACVIKDADFSNGEKFRRYVINSDGRRIAEEHRGR